MKYIHDKSAFKDGDIVVIRDKVEKAAGWDDGWADGMNPLLGSVGLVIQADNVGGRGVRVVSGRTGATYWYASCSLVLTSRPATAMTIPEFLEQQKKSGGNVPQQTPQTPVTSANKKPRRIRVGAGPWDAAPCTHLRWHLMGFFREKLALVKTKIEVEAGKFVEVSQIEVACTKCGTKMTLQAK